MPESKKQVRLAYAVVAGKSDAMPQKVAREIISKYENMSDERRKKLPTKK